MEWSIALFAALVACSAFFSGIEISYFSISPGRVRSMVARNLRYARDVERLKRNPERLLVTILVGNNLVNISAAAVATKVAVDAFGSIGVGIASGVVTLIVLVFGEIVPKSLGQVHAETITRFAAKPVMFIEFALSPVVAFFEAFMRWMYRFFPGAERRSLVSEEEIRSMMHIGVEEGSVERHEREFVERLFRFNDTPVANCMVPKERVVVLDGDVPVKSIAHFAANSGYSRFPVYEGGEDSILGLVHIKDIVRASHSKGREREVKHIASELRRVPADARLDDVLRSMQKERRHMYLVVNAEGDYVGVVTMEDILEELLGEIHDESDRAKIG